MGPISVHNTLRTASIYLGRLRQLERYPALVVLFAGRVEIEIRDQDPAPMSRAKVKQRRTLNGIIPDFHGPAVFEHQKSGLQRRIGINLGGWIGLGPFRSTGRGNLLHWWNVGAFPLSTAVKYGWSTLIVSIVLSIIISLLLVGSISGIVVAVGDWDCIPDWAVDARIIAMMMTVVVSVSLVSVVAIVSVMAIVYAVIRDESRTGHRCVASWTNRGNAGWRAVDRTPTEAGRGH